MKEYDMLVLWQQTIQISNLFNLDSQRHRTLVQDFRFYFRAYKELELIQD